MSYPMEDTSNTGPTPAVADPASGRATIGNPAAFRIARAGARPLHFSGSELAMAMSFTPELPYWYEINIYRTTDTDFVVAIRLFFQAEEMDDKVEAWRCGSLEEAFVVVESYDAANDVVFSLDPTLQEKPAAELAANAISLMAQISAARKHYGGLVGEILSELDAV